MTSSSEDFEGIIDAARSGDASALGHLYDWLQPAILRYLRWQEPSWADDLASDTWLAVAGRLAAFEGNEAAFKGWVFAIARGRLADHRRQAARRRTRPVDPAAFAGDVADDDPAGFVANRASAQDAIARLTACLSREQAEVVVLRVVGGLSVEEVARILGKRPGAIRMLQHRALRQLAAQLDENFLLEA